MWQQAIIYGKKKITEPQEKAEYTEKVGGQVSAFKKLNKEL